MTPSLMVVNLNLDNSDYDVGTMKMTPLRAIILVLESLTENLMNVQYSL